MKKIQSNFRSFFYYWRNVFVHWWIIPALIICTRHPSLSVFPFTSVEVTEISLALTTTPEAQWTLVTITIMEVLLVPVDVSRDVRRIHCFIASLSKLQHAQTQSSFPIQPETTYRSTSTVSELPFTLQGPIPALRVHVRKGWKPLQ